MRQFFCLFFVTILFVPIFVGGQVLNFSGIEDDLGNLKSYEILGKIENKIFIYESYEKINAIAIFNPKMQRIAKKKITDIPNNVIEIKFIQYKDFFFTIYQYQINSVMYCYVTKIYSDGSTLQKPVLLDSTDLSFTATGSIYTILNSDDKSKLMLVKMAKRGLKEMMVTTISFDSLLQEKRLFALPIKLHTKNDEVGNFILDNDGDLFACQKTVTSKIPSKITQLNLLYRANSTDSFLVIPVDLSDSYLFAIRGKPDNLNKHIVFTSLCNQQMNNNDITGLYYFVWDKIADSFIINTSAIFSDAVRIRAADDGKPTKTTFNSFILRDLVLRRDGGAIITAESTFSEQMGQSPYNNYSYIPQSSMYGNRFGYYPWGSYGNMGGTITRYTTNNALIMSFGMAGNIEWCNILDKSQTNDNDDNLLSYNMLNRGNKLDFLYNTYESKHFVLVNKSLAPNGSFSRVSTINKTMRQYNFIPKKGKQTALQQTVMPCELKGKTYFVKIDFY